MDEPLTYFSTFTGIGGFELGIQDAVRAANRRSQSDTQSQPSPGPGLQPAQGQGTRAARRRPGTGAADQPYPRPLCVGYSEINAPAIKTYEEHFDHENYGDITAINPADLPEFRLLVGGFPCQTFSVAGKRAGFNEARGTLFFDVARICADKRPRHLVLENVKGLLSHDGGKTVETIFRVLTDLGYDVEWQLFNSKDWGVPQNRERIYIIGHRRDECRSKVLPLTPTSGSACHLFARAEGINGHDQIKRVYALDGSSPTLPTGTGGNHQPKVYETPRVRRLTPMECERLQGFPDGWTLGSDAQRYKQCGNAVTTNVVSAVMSALMETCEL